MSISSLHVGPIEREQCGGLVRDIDRIKSRISFDIYMANVSGWQIGKSKSKRGGGLRR